MQFGKEVGALLEKRLVGPEADIPAEFGFNCLPRASLFDEINFFLKEELLKQLEDVGGEDLLVVGEENFFLLLLWGINHILL